MGRHIRTTIIAMKASASRGSGMAAKPISSVSATPSSSYAATAPSTEPSPPTTISASDLYAGIAPMSGWTSL